MEFWLILKIDETVKPMFSEVKTGHISISKTHHDQDEKAFLPTHQSSCSFVVVFSFGSARVRFKVGLWLEN